MAWLTPRVSKLTLVDGAPKLEIQNLPYGFQYAAIRNALSGGKPMHYVRSTQFVAPNWAQALEGAIDSAHYNFLHNDLNRLLAQGDYTGGGGLFDKVLVGGAPRLEVDNLPYGFHYAGIRDATLQDGTSKQYVRTTKFVAPSWALFSAPEGWIFSQVFVPVDDENTVFYFIHGLLFHSRPAGRRNYRQALPSQDSRVVRRGDLGDDFRMDFHSASIWRQGRDLMDRRKYGDKFSFSGMPGNQTEDLRVQESMGPIFDRTREHLGTSDLAVSARVA